MLIKEYDDQKFENLHEINQFLKKHKLSQLTPYIADYFNNPIVTKEIKFII